jgi:putative sporulation protein YyaC
LKDWIDVYKSNAVLEVGRAVLKHLSGLSSNEKIVILCIGTDRSTGDSLGPLVGYRLSRYRTLSALVVGTLDHPVHAVNLKETLERINREIPNNFIIAVDACLGTHGNIGYIKVAKGPMKPGSGLKKDLPETGDIHITGIVNHGGFMDFMVLQNTRLSLVMKMSETIADGLQYALWKYHRTGGKLLNPHMQ